MEKRRTMERIVLGFCVLLTGVTLLTGCGTPLYVSNPRVIPASRSSGPTASPHVELSSSGPFAGYDRVFIEAVEQRWYDILDREGVTPPKGEVVLQFVLAYNGHISDMQVTKSTVNRQAAWICQRAVLDPAPYPAWPVEMRRTMGDQRSIQFTFYY